MPRAGQRRPPTGERLSDRIAIGVLTRTYPPALVDQVIAQAGARERRHRLLPARVVVYYVLAMCLFSQVGYEEVARLLTEGLAWARRWQGSWQVPTTGAITRARTRLGPEPLQALFAQAVRPLAVPATVGAWYRDWRLVSMDGTTLDVADTADNAAAFGRPPASRGGSAFPQVRVMALAECGTHAIIDAELGPYRTGELSLAPALARSLGAGMLVLGDRGLVSFDLWRTMAATGADLLWRTRTNAVLPVVQDLPDGSYLSQIVAARDHRQGRDPITVRVIEYALDDAGGGQAQPDPAAPYRLVTTVLDPERAPARELAALYAQRWELETALDELKTHQHGPGMVLRSKTAQGVEQEVWAMLLVHYAIRQLMHQAALHVEVDPDRLSFVRSLRLVRRQVTRQAGFSPSASGQGHH
jgi:Insertion element 4 transposase N-terminal/Transposase DDE domain